MKVRELIEDLQKLDQDREVIVSKDSEGNSYSPLSDVSSGSYVSYNVWSGEYGIEELTIIEINQGYSAEYVITDGQPAICLHPLN